VALDVFLIAPHFPGRVFDVLDPVQEIAKLRAGDYGSQLILVEAGAKELKELCQLLARHRDISGLIITKALRHTQVYQF